MQNEVKQKPQGENHQLFKSEPASADSETLGTQEGSEYSFPQGVTPRLPRVLDDPRALSPSKILQLQRTIGNQAVMRLIARAKENRKQTPYQPISARPTVPFAPAPANLKEIAPPTPENIPKFSSQPTVQRLILKNGKKAQKVENTYAYFPSSQLKNAGLTTPMLNHARPYHNAKKYYTIKQVVEKAKAKYTGGNNLRVNPPNPGFRFKDFKDLIKHFDTKGHDTTTLTDKFVTNNHGPAFNALLDQVPFTSQDANLVAPSAQLYSRLTHHINKTHVPQMIRTSSYFGETIEAMVNSDASGGTGYTSSNKGSMFESWCATNLIASSGKVTIAKQGTMHQQRQSDGYVKSTKTLYDAKHYYSKMPTSTNDNQYDDYKEILTKGYKGTGGEVISKVCYIFPDAKVAGMNTHLKTADILVAYPDKASTGLEYV